MRRGCVGVQRTCNNSITDEQRALAGIPIHKTTRTPVATPDSFPVLAPVKASHLFHLLVWHDSETNGRAKPPGVQFCEIRCSVIAPGAPVPIDAEELDWLANDSAAPYSAGFEPEDLGKTACYAFRWVNTRGNPGPWSSITSVVVS